MYEEKFKIEELFSLQKCSCKVGKKDITEKKVEKVVSGSVHSKKKTGIRKFADNFIQIDINQMIWF